MRPYSLHPLSSGRLLWRLLRRSCAWNLKKPLSLTNKQNFKPEVSQQHTMTSSQHDDVTMTSLLTRSRILNVEHTSRKNRVTEFNEGAPSPHSPVLCWVLVTHHSFSWSLVILVLSLSCCDVMWGSVTSREGVWRHVRECDVMWRHVKECHVTWGCLTSRLTLSSDVAIGAY
jgi:hypothetical protein